MKMGSLRGLLLFVAVFIATFQFGYSSSNKTEKDCLEDASRILEDCIEIYLEDYVKAAYTYRNYLRKTDNDTVDDIRKRWEKMKVDPPFDDVKKIKEKKGKEHILEKFRECVEQKINDSQCEPHFATYRNLTLSKYPEDLFNETYHNPKSVIELGECIYKDNGSKGGAASEADECEAASHTYKRSCRRHGKINCLGRIVRKRCKAKEALFNSSRYSLMQDNVLCSEHAQSSGVALSGLALSIFMAAATAVLAKVL